MPEHPGAAGGEVHRVLARAATQIKDALRTGEEPIQACPHQGSQRAAQRGVGEIGVVTGGALIKCRSVQQ